MGDPTKDFFTRMAQLEELPARVRRVQGSIRVDLLRDGRVDHWLLQLLDGRLSVLREERDADCILILAKESFDKVVNGQEDLNVMLPRGDLRLEGSLQMLTVLRILLPGPPGAVDPRDLARSGWQA